MFLGIGSIGRIVHEVAVIEFEEICKAEQFALSVPVPRNASEKPGSRVTTFLVDVDNGLLFELSLVHLPQVL